MKIAIKTLGCKSNRYESDFVFDALKDSFNVFEVNEGASSFARSSRKPADLLIVNSCTVTHVADRKTRQSIRSFKRQNPDARVAVFGCSSNVQPEKYKEMKMVDFIADTSQQIIEFANDLAKSIKENDKCSYQQQDHHSGLRTRSLVKIQDGCNNYCSYCIIPHARGPEFSFASNEILAECQKKEQEGFKEIVLTGINIGEWKEEEMEIADLIKFLIQETKKVRFRISSIEPKNFSNKFYDLFKTGRLCDHMHISLQSGSDGVLKRMRRNYDASFFKEICQKFQQACPDIAITTDVIVGFPGETEKEFNETLDFVESVSFSRIHVFPYSKRANTPASKMPNQVDEYIKKERSKVLRGLSRKLELDFWNLQLGKIKTVLIEEEQDGYMCGRTSNYIPVKIATSPFIKINEFLMVKLSEIAEDSFVKAFSMKKGLPEWQSPFNY